MTSAALPNDAVSGRRIRRSITATWLYTSSAVVLLQLMLVLLWWSGLVLIGAPLSVVLTVLISAGAWVLATIALLRIYRHRLDTGAWLQWRELLVPLVLSAAAGLATGIATGSAAAGALPPLGSLILVAWAPGLRRRIVVAVTALLAALCFIDSRTMTLPSDAYPSWVVLAFFATTYPALCVLSLWWWDVLVHLDRARASEARLAAAQERLRVATDVHDLQGHHLQVLALQLELAERLLDQDHDGARAQLRQARATVDDARQGTRDLATQFRSVPLNDEVHNAVDLLRAACTTAEADVAVDADEAPAQVLGPVIREATTNVLRHGGGRWARLSLTGDGDQWRFQIANDIDPDAPTTTGGSGLEGIARRIREAGGDAHSERDDNRFTLTVTLPRERSIA